MSEEQKDTTPNNPIYEVINVDNVMKELKKYPLVGLERLKIQTQMTISQRIQLSEKMFGNIMRTQMLKALEQEAYRICDEPMRQFAECIGTHSMPKAYQCRPLNKKYQECLVENLTEEKYEAFYRKTKIDSIRRYYENEDYKREAEVTKLLDARIAELRLQENK
eukprot:249064_1